MKILLVTVVTLLAMVLFVAAASAIHETLPAETTAPMPGPDAEDLSRYIRTYNPYQSWNLWPDKGKLYKGKEPHGSLLTTYVNTSASLAASRKTAMADGSIIVKENYTAEKELVALTVMYKIKGYNPSAGDWFWAKYGPDWSVQASGRVEGCIKCHEAVKSNDYIFSGKLK